jgi:hypothetical protein
MTTPNIRAALERLVKTDYGSASTQKASLAWVICMAAEWTDAIAAARAALAEPVAAEPTDEQLLESAAKELGYKRIPSDKSCLTADASDLLDFARAVLARWGHPVASPAGDGPSLEVLGPLIAWLTEEAIQAADKDCPKTAGMLTWAAQVIGERVDEDAPWGNLAPAPKPIPLPQAGEVEV